MTEHELFDLDSKKGKAGGGYCTYIPKWRSPFIFSNFNNTSGDIDVLTHEAGHAFQVYSSRDAILPNYFLNFWLKKDLQSFCFCVNIYTVIDLRKF